MSKKLAKKTKASTEWLSNDYKFNPPPSATATSPRVDQIPASGPGKRGKPITREQHESERTAMVEAHGLGDGPYGLGARNLPPRKGKHAAPSSLAPVDRGSDPSRRPSV